MIKVLPSGCYLATTGVSFNKDSVWLVGLCDLPGEREHLLILVKRKQEL